MNLYTVIAQDLTYTSPHLSGFRNSLLSCNRYEPWINIEQFSLPTLHFRPNLPKLEYELFNFDPMVQISDCVTASKV